MPLARYAMYAMGAQLHIAATWDRGYDWGRRRQRRRISSERPG